MVGIGFMKKSDQEPQTRTGQKTTVDSGDNEKKKTTRAQGQL
jgi:hypothetical protein